MTIRHYAVLAPYDKQGRVLFQDRRSVSKYGEEWGFFGGGVDGDESIEEALVREIKEELGYDLTKYTLLNSYHTTLPDMETIEHLFVTPCPPLDQLQVLEGDDMVLYSIDSARSLHLMSGYDRMLTDLDSFLAQNTHIS